MKRCLLAWAAAVFFAGPLPATAQHGITAQPDALVRNLYREVVARHPHDIPKGADWEVFAPYLSRGLLHRIDLAGACSADRDRQSSDSQLMARIVSAYGLFSEEAEPQTFQIEKTETDKDGSFRVYVNLTVEKPPRRPWTWPVAAIVIREGGHFVVDDVIHIDNHIYGREADRRHRRL